MTGGYDALIFDCDGVLVNSEHIAQEIERSLLAAVGMHYADEEFSRRFSGIAEREYRALLREDARTRFAVALAETVFEEINAAIGAAYEERLEIIAGADVLAAAWPRRKAVASSSSLGTLRFKLRKTGLDAHFGEHVYSADSVAVGKPDPAVFLHSARGLGCAPERCVVVEDSVNGVIAAKRAGMTAIGFVGGAHCLAGHADRLSANGADRVFAAHAEIAAYFGLERHAPPPLRSATAGA
jgi:HAD superfamily hydrolase (TIGR01509 family)